MFSLLCLAHFTELNALWVHIGCQSGRAEQHVILYTHIHVTFFSPSLPVEGHLGIAHMLVIVTLLRHIEFFLERMCFI